jgi:hypothetical protein
VPALHGATHDLLQRRRQHSHHCNRQPKHADLYICDGPVTRQHTQKAAAVAKSLLRSVQRPPAKESLGLQAAARHTVSCILEASCRAAVTAVRPAGPPNSHNANSNDNCGNAQRFSNCQSLLLQDKL